jgi:hypothetical protein
LVVSTFVVLAPVAGHAAAVQPQAVKTAPKPEQQKLRGVPLWLLLGGLGTAAIILAASHQGKDEGKSAQNTH